MFYHLSKRNYYFCSYDLEAPSGINKRRLKSTFQIVYLWCLKKTTKHSVGKLLIFFNYLQLGIVS